MNDDRAVPVFLIVVVLGIILIGVGTSTSNYKPGKHQHTPGSAQVIQEPVAPTTEIPESMRFKNWGGGSCVFASWCTNLEHAGQEELAAYFRSHFSGGESLDGLSSKCDRLNIDYYSTSSGDPAFLEWASRTRRFVTIFYYGNHCVNFVGYTEDGREAVLLDNNSIHKYNFIEKQQFLNSWKHQYGGCAITPATSPAAPLPWVKPKK